MAPIGPNPKRQTLIAVRTQVRIAIDAVKQAKDQLINAGLMPNTVEELTDQHNELIALSFVISKAAESLESEDYLEGVRRERKATR